MVSQFETRSHRRNRSGAALTSKDDHPIQLQGVGLSQNGKHLDLLGSLRPTILKRTDQDFIAALLQELKSAASLPDIERPVPVPATGKPAIAHSLANDRNEDELLTLFQPVHRTFHVALLEVVCNQWNQPFLQPRLDPQKIESAGLVVRRIGLDGRLEGWRHKRYWDPNQNTWKTLQNWIPFSRSDMDLTMELGDDNPADELLEDNLDPDPTLRPPGINAGHVEINRRLQTDLFPLAESTSSLFVAPPDVCEAMGRTILFGLIPLTSPEVSEGDPIISTPADAQAQKALDDEIQKRMLPYYLRPGDPSKQPTRSEPNHGLSVIIEDLDTLLNHKPPTPQQDSFRVFYATLQQLKYHFRLLEDNPDSKALLNLLNQIPVNVAPSQPQRLGDYLKQAIERLVARMPGATVVLPENWAVISESQSQAIISAISDGLKTQLANLTAGEGRFEEQGRKYRIRAFVRVKRADGCPPKLIWSQYSEPFTIKPWYEASDLPPVRVTLPDVLNPKGLAALKPNVAFAVPRRLFNFLQNNDPTDLMDGKGSDSDENELGLDWFCGFNIPIITLCAFIVLNIFLQLFNLIFWWLPMVKICIPIPKNLFPQKPVP